MHHVVDGVDDRTGTALRDLLGADPVDAVIDLVGPMPPSPSPCPRWPQAERWPWWAPPAATLRRPWYGTLPRDG